MGADDRTSPLVLLLKYAELDRALRWLVEVAGLQVDTRDAADSMAVLRVGNGLMFAQHDSTATSMSGGRVYLYVGDVDAHYQRALAVGVDAPPPRDAAWGDRIWNTTDPQGHPWTFASPSR